MSARFDALKLNPGETCMGSLPCNYGTIVHDCKDDQEADT